MGSTSIDVPNVWSAVFARCCSESCSDTATPGHRGILVLQVPVSLKRLWGVTKRNISMLYASNKNSIYIIIICRFSLFLHSGKIKISKQRRHLFPFFRSEVLLFRHPNNHSTFIKQKEKGKDSEMESVSNSWVGGKYWMSDSLCEPENLWEMGRRAAISNNPVFSLSLSLSHTPCDATTALMESCSSDPLSQLASVTISSRPSHYMKRLRIFHPEVTGNLTKDTD